MIQTRYKILNGFMISMLMFLLCGLQTSFWHQMTGGTPAPQFWLIIILYLVLYRSYLTALAFSYFLAMIVRSFSSITLGMILPLLFVLISPASYIKSRMFWPNTRYFLISTMAFTITYQILTIFLSNYLELNPVSISFYQRSVEVILTTLWAAPVYWLLNYVDRLSLPEILDTQGTRE